MPSRIEDYALIGDTQTAALVGLDGSIDWLCLPRYDSDAVFARILGDKAGHWSLRPTGEYAVERRYVPGSLVIETTYTTATGIVRVRDAMAFAPGQSGHPTNGAEQAKRLWTNRQTDGTPMFGDTPRFEALKRKGPQGASSLP